MRRRPFVLSLALLGSARELGAQQTGRSWRVGVVWAGTASGSQPYAEAFLAGMKVRGYELGRNLILDARYGEGDPPRFPGLVEEVLAPGPDLLIGSSTVIAIEMKRRTARIPIVTGTTSDPVASGLVQSLARPGGNVTGMAVQIHELGAKHIELMTELLPGMRRAAILADAANEQSISERYERIAAAAAAAKGCSVETYRVDGLEQIQEAFRRLARQPVDALLINPSPRFNRLRREIGRAALETRLPSISFINEYPADGGLMSYGPSFVEAYRRTAYFVDRIFNGAKPGDLPIEQPTRFELVINLGTARALGLAIPQTILQRADEVIE